MNDDTALGLPGDQSVDERMRRMREQLQPLTIPGSGAGIFYDTDDPFDTELRVEFHDGQTVNSVVVPLAENDVVFLQQQVSDVRAKQRQLLGVENVEDARWKPTGAVDSVDTARTGATAEENSERENGGSEEEPVSAWVSRWKKRGRKAGDPMGFGNILKAVPVSDNASMRALIVVVLIFAAVAVISGILSVAT
ncbi:MAG: hypothetical protein L0H59_00135 [Tomitella sp.]|nr:hypothetical protein [Tomitella sp.]